MLRPSLGKQRRAGLWERRYLPICLRSKIAKGIGARSCWRESICSRTILWPETSLRLQHTLPNCLPIK